jgi:hypothetical protein
MGKLLGSMGKILAPLVELVRAMGAAGSGE